MDFAAKWIIIVLSWSSESELCMHKVFLSFARNISNLSTDLIN